MLLTPTARLDSGRRPSANRPLARRLGCGGRRVLARRRYAQSVLSLEKLDLSEIAEALQHNSDYESLFLINSETGKIEFWTSDCGIDGQNPVELDDLPEELITIDPLPSHVWYSDMQDFIDELSDEQAARRLARAIHGSGAFRRFRAELEEEYPHLKQAWYDFRDVRALRRAAEWLAENKLIDHDARDRYLATHPDTPIP
jgi:uncharacterized protein UPF0158